MTNIFVFNLHPHTSLSCIPRLAFSAVWLLTEHTWPDRFVYDQVKWKSQVETTGTGRTAVSGYAASGRSRALSEPPFQRKSGCLPL